VFVAGNSQVPGVCGAGGCSRATPPQPVGGTPLESGVGPQKPGSVHLAPEVSANIKKAPARARGRTLVSQALPKPDSNHAIGLDPFAQLAAEAESRTGAKDGQGARGLPEGVRVVVDICPVVIGGNRHNVSDADDLLS
jgi:hypothetical protein